MDNNQAQSTTLFVDNLPNRLTIFRICLIPFVVACLYINTTQILTEYHSLFNWTACWIFVAAAFTDWVDGYIARKREIVTVFGSFLDPIADKFLVITTLIMIVPLYRLHISVVLILVLREVYMTSLRLLAQIEGINVPVDQFGKWKTVFQLIGIPMILANEPLFIIPTHKIGPILLYISAILSLFSAFNYTKNSIKKLKIKMKEKKGERRQH